MKAIVMAGGTGSRMAPVTGAVSKHLLPVYNQPLIYHSISTLMLAGSRDILIISDPHNLPAFRMLLKTGEQWGINISYCPQQTPRGVGEAFSLAKSFIFEKTSALMLADNIFHGPGLGTALAGNASLSGAKIFAHRVSNPQDYGVVEFDKFGSVVNIEEKPASPSSSFAIPGLYFFDNKVIDVAKEIRPSARGELEITDILNWYKEDGGLQVQELPRGTYWIDAGTFDALADATQFVRSVEKRQGLKIGCPEEIAWRLGYIDDNALATLAHPLLQSGYGKYLMALLEGE